MTPENIRADRERASTATVAPDHGICLCYLTRGSILPVHAEI